MGGTIQVTSTLVSVPPSVSNCRFYQAAGLTEVEGEGNLIERRMSAVRILWQRTRPSTVWY